MDDTRVKARFLPGRLLLVGGLASILAACQTAPSDQPASDAGPMPSMEDGAAPEKAGASPFQRGMYAYLTAEMARQEGRLDIASEWYARAARVTGRGTLFERATEAALHGRQGEKAAAYAREWREAAPERPEPLLALAQARLLLGKPGEAVGVLGALVDQFPRAEEVYLGAGERLVQSGGVETAVRVLRETAGNNPDNAAAQLAYGYLLARLEQREQAADVLERALELRPHWEAAAVELARTRSVNEGMGILRDFIDEHPRADQARLRYGQGLLAQGGAEEAERVFLGLAEEGMRDARVYMGLGMARSQQGDWRGARRALQRVLELDPGNNEALFHLGQVTKELGSYEAAADYFGRVNGGRYLEQARMEEAAAAVELGDLQRALRLVRQVRAYRPDEPEYFRLEARILAEIGQYRAAEEVASKGLQQDPDHKELLYTRSLVREKVGDYAGMEADIRSVIEDHPQEARAYNFLGYSLADRGVRLSEALRLLERANELEPNQGYILDSLGWAYFRLGRLEAAESYLRQALERSEEEDPEILVHLGEVLEARGRPGEAREMWLRALEMVEEDSDMARELRRRLDEGKQ
ncbi:hypothetical protein AN478_02345 [Thiohalorhabdus denitrificans]|uniref:Flp pilus assembly protein TadD, contains TPR repeats n=1 Tax=Thiohalorhabdus denitrificans TaxID=381306 RepID=A0A0P9C8T5_9GAMM|nr:tetratricopeptide repeat protein [Thiohalorhabdus denitrificans]KPV41436.1 hypothetical protein AN478_02345 [Thiohalorhabdus denitrificans]SCY27233.1 Flp pilus assembly protein TadD, contains TPR repeats [Thiohalorhabdus denitrificans]